MKRRTVLAAAAATTATVSVAGCLADDGSGGDGGSDDGDDGSADGSGGGGSNGDDEPSGGGDGSSDGTDGSSDDDSDHDDGSGVGGTEITGRSIETTERTCGSQDVSEASMTVGDGAIVVRGTISASTPCHDAVLSSAAVEEGTLRIGVSLSQQDGVCQQCIGEISYEATIELGDPRDLDSVQVSHSGGGMHQFEVE